MGTESSPVVKSGSPCVSPSPEPQKVLDTPVGSQKRKARKSKITHLVRTADGRVSPAEGELNTQFPVTVLFMISKQITPLRNTLHPFWFWLGFFMYTTVQKFVRKVCFFFLLIEAAFI